MQPAGRPPHRAACHPSSCAPSLAQAIDKDSQTVSHPEVFAVFATVPLPGAVVEQPDGDVAYGAGQRPAPGAYQPPTVQV